MAKKKLCRHRDLGATGHSCTTVIPVKATQKTVFANNRPVARWLDPGFPHLIRQGIKCVGHTSMIYGRSKTVFVQGRAVARVRDGFDRAIMITGSANVFAGG